MKRGAEFSVYQGGSPARRSPQPVPDNLNLRLKQRSLTNLTLDGERRVYALETDKPPPRFPPRQSSLVYPSSSSQRAGGSLQGSPRKEALARNCGPRARSLSLSLTKMLSQSEHSLIPVPWRSTGRLQRASYGGHPRGETPREPEQQADAAEEGSRGRSDEDQAGGGKRGSGENGGGYWAEEEVSGGGAREGTAQLDKDVILTMLGDLEQVLHTRPRPRKLARRPRGFLDRDSQLP